MPFKSLAVLLASAGTMFLALQPPADPEARRQPAVAAPPPPGVLLPTRELVSLADLVVRPTGVNWPRWRMISFASLPPDQLAARQNAVRYALGTLNRGRAEPSTYLVSLANTLWAVDTVALQWPAEFWEAVAREDHYYSEAGVEVLGDFFAARLGTRIPILRQDTFLAGCWEPDRYVLAAGVPATRADFQRAFLTQESARGATFGVVSERLSVTRHPGKVAHFVGPEGSVWMRVLYSNSPSNREARLTAANLEDGDHYEFFWQLPDGLDGYASYDRQGRLALTVPTSVSRDREGEGVRLAASCVACHATGARSLDHADPADKLVLFRAADSLQWDKDKLMFLSRQDARRFGAALQTLGVTGGLEAVRAAKEAADQTHTDLTAEEAARELGLPAAQESTRAAFGDLVAAAASGRINKMFLDAARQRLGRQ